MILENSQRRYIPLKTITTKVGSGATPKGGQNSYKSSGISLIRSLNVYDLRFVPNGLAFIDDTQAAQLKNVEVQPQDILLNITGASVARCCIVPDQVLPARVNQHVSIVRIDKSKAVPRYVLYSINSPRIKSHLLAIAQGGATREALTKEKIEDFAIPLPSYETQRKIAAILSAYDDLIENNLRRIKILEEMAQRLYREWFVHFRFPGHEKVRLVDSPLGKIPEGWEVVSTRDAIEVTPKTPVPKDGQKPFVSMGNLKSGSMLIDGFQVRQGNSGSKFRNCDTLFARITPCLENGKTAFVQFLRTSQEVAIGSTEFIVLRSKTLCPELVYLIARSAEFRENAIKSMTGASGRQRVQEKCFDKYQFAHPDKTIICLFEQTVRPMFEDVWLLFQKNRILRQTRDLLLPRLISGELDVSELAIKTIHENGK